MKKFDTGRIFWLSLPTLLFYAGCIFYNMVIFDWPAVEGLSSIGLLIIAVLTIIWSINEYRENISRDASNKTFEQIEKFNSEKINELSDEIVNNPDGNNLIYSLLEPKSQNINDIQTRRNAIKVLAFFENLGLLLKNNKVNFNEIYEFFQLTIPPLFNKLSDYILFAQRFDRSSWEYFVELSKRIIKEKETRRNFVQD